MDSPLYRYSRIRTQPPRVLATPNVHAVLDNPRTAGRLSAALACCFAIARDPGTKLHGGHTGLGDYAVETLWSYDPAQADLFVIRGPGDVLPYWRNLTLFRENLDPALLEGLIPVHML